MRVISQDGVFDIPYEICSVWCRGSAVMCYMSGDNTHTVLATYSIEEKAKKAMEMLREEYGKCATGANSYFAFVHPKVFQFPKEEELE